MWNNKTATMHIFSCYRYDENGRWEYFKGNKLCLCTENVYKILLLKLYI
jgi:hypothetical protein